MMISVTLVKHLHVALLKLQPQHKLQQFRLFYFAADKLMRGQSHITRAEQFINQETRSVFSKKNTLGEFLRTGQGSISYSELCTRYYYWRQFKHTGGGVFMEVYS